MILNLTQHEPSKAQIEAGVVNPADKEAVRSLLNVPMVGTKNSLTVGYAKMSQEGRETFLEFRAANLAQIAMEWQAEQVHSQLLKLANMDLTPYQLLMQLEQAKACRVMIGGFMPLMPYLIAALKRRGMVPVYALSERVVTEHNGTKTTVFEHLGFDKA
jgi:hypothetical protein